MMKIKDNNYTNETALYDKKSDKISVNNKVIQKLTEGVNIDNVSY